MIGKAPEIEKRWYLIKGSPDRILQGEFTIAKLNKIAV